MPAPRVPDASYLLWCICARLTSPVILWSYLCIRTGQVFLFLQFIYTHVHVQNNPSLSSCFVEDRVAFMTADVNFAAIWNNFMSLSPSKSSNNFYRGWKHRDCHDHHSDQPQHDHAACRSLLEKVFLCINVSLLVFVLGLCLTPWTPAVFFASIFRFGNRSPFWQKVCTFFS